MDKPRDGLITGAEAAGATVRIAWRRAVREDANINGWDQMPAALIQEWARVYQDRGRQAAWKQIQQFNRDRAPYLYLGLLVFLEFGQDQYEAGRPIPEEGNDA